MKIPLPRNKTELALLTKWYFGKELHLKQLSNGFYEVAEDYSSYHGEGWNFSTHDGEGYSYSARFWNTILGPLGTGGIGRASYGSFTPSRGHRHTKRLESLRNSIHKTSPDPIRPVFARLASQPRARREWKKAR